MRGVCWTRRIPSTRSLQACRAERVESQPTCTTGTFAQPTLPRGIVDRQLQVLVRVIPRCWQKNVALGDRRGVP